MIPKSAKTWTYLDFLETFNLLLKVTPCDTENDKLLKQCYRLILKTDRILKIIEKQNVL